MASDFFEGDRPRVDELTQPAKTPLVFRQFLRYAAVGFLNAVVYLAIVNALSIFLDIYAGAFIIIINTVAASVAVTQSYFLNKFWAFESKSPATPAEFLKFATVNAGAVALNVIIVFSATTYIRPLFDLSPLAWENAANILALGAVTLWNFSGFKLFIFPDREPPA